MKMAATCTQSLRLRSVTARRTSRTTGPSEAQAASLRPADAILLAARRDLQPAAATELELTPEVLAEIEDVQIEAQGERYSEANQRMVDR